MVEIVPGKFVPKGMADLFMFADFCAHSIFHVIKKNGVSVKSKKAKESLQLICESQRYIIIESLSQIQARVAGFVKVGGQLVPDGEEIIPTIFPWTVVFNVKDDRLIHKNEKGTWLLVPVDEEMYDEFIGGIEIIDGQHRTVSFSKDFCRVKGELEFYPVHAYVYVGATEDEKMMVFQSMNGERKNVSTEMGYRNQMKLGQNTSEERTVYAAVEKLASGTVRDDNDMPVVPEMFGNVNLGRNEGRLSAKSAAQDSCLTTTKSLRKDNVIKVLKRCGKHTPDEIAQAFNTLHVSMNRAHFIKYELHAPTTDKLAMKKNVRLNLFSRNTSQTDGMLSRASYSNFIWAMSPAIFACANELGGINQKNLTNVICVLMNDVLGVKDLRENNSEVHLKIVKGHNTMLGYAMEQCGKLAAKYGIQWEEI